MATSPRSRLYMLGPDRRVVPVEDPVVWGKWFEENFKDRVVHQTDVAGCRVSTVFLAIDHQFGTGPPVLWETMVFGDGRGADLDWDRCSGTYEQAETMHWKMCDRVCAALGVEAVAHE